MSSRCELACESKKAALRSAGGPVERWVSGRVLGKRMHKGVQQFKISLDGYDSENDEWVDETDQRVIAAHASHGT